jgi:hypothetical protein
MVLLAHAKISPLARPGVVKVDRGGKPPIV